MDKYIKTENVDHIYCNKLNATDKLLCNEKSNFIGDDKTVKKMKNFILSNINLIEELQNQLVEKDQLIAKLLHENESLKYRLQRYKGSKTSNKKSDNSKEANNNNKNSIGNNNNVPVNKNKASDKIIKIESATSKDKRASIDSSDDEAFRKKPSEDSQESISIKLINKNLFLMTKTPYLINDWKTYELEDEEIQKSFDEEVSLEIPRWIESELPSTPADELENIQVEDVSDEVFLKRHSKFEVDERRRKKWDLMRFREQKNIERLKKRHFKEEYAEEATSSKQIKKTMTSFFPDAEAIKFIQISDDLPISAFGEQIPKMQPKDFSLPWLACDNENDNSNIYSIDNLCANGNTRMKVRTKFITRCSNPMTK